MWTETLRQGAARARRDTTNSRGGGSTLTKETPMPNAHVSTQAATSESQPLRNEVEIDMTPSAGKVPQVPDGVYSLTLQEIGSAPSQYGGQVPVFKFTVDGHENEGTLNLFVSKRRWDLVLTALKVTYDGGTKFTMKHEALVGRRCQGVVQNVPGTKDPSKKFPRLTTLLPAAG
jgi:hypothetical protein